MRTLNDQVTKLVAEHLRTNVAALAVRPSRTSQLLRWLFRPRLLWRYLAIYVAIDLGAVTAEFLLGAGTGISGLSIEHTAALVAAVPGVAITAQTGVLAVITLAIALVGLLLQREEASADIQVYYHESLAFETTASSLALVAVLAIETAWPLQSALHSLTGPGDGPSFELPLTFVHLAWLALNVVAGWNFVAVTLRFVQRTTRAEMRERYVANVLMRADLQARLRQTIYGSGLLETADGVDVGYTSIDAIFGFPLPRGDDEVVRQFDAPVVLTDVRMWLLAWAVGRWRSRVGPAPGHHKAQPLTDTRPRLSFPLRLDLAVEGTVPICRRSGDVPLDRIERQAIRWAFKFGNIRKRKDLPNIEQVVEEQSERVLERMRRRAFSAFEVELSDMVRLHHFLLALGKSQSPQLDGINLAELTGGDFSSPHDRWIRRYVHIFDGAIEMLLIDDSFLGSSAQVIPLLVTDHDADMSHGVSENLLRLGPMLMFAVERWVGRHLRAETHADGKVRHVLPAPERRALANALPHVVGAWEGALDRSSLGLRPGRDEEDTDAWDRYRRAWPAMRRHLAETARCLAAAVWAGDEEGALLFRSSLARWPGTALLETNGVAELRYRRLLMPDVLDLEWSAAMAEVNKLSFDHGFPLDPAGVFAKTVRAVQHDVLLATSMVFLLWQSSGRTDSQLPGVTARALIEGEDLRSSGSPEPPERDTLRVTADLLRLQAAGYHHVEGTHGAWLDRLIRDLDGLTEGASVPGRVHMVETLHGRDGLAVMEGALIAAAVGTAPERMEEVFAELASSVDVLPRQDQLLRDMLRRLETWRELMGTPSPELTSATQTLGGDAMLGAIAGDAALRSAASGIERVRHDRLRNLPLAQARLDPLRAAAESALLDGPTYLPFFLDVAISRSQLSHPGETAVIMERLGKGSLVEPEMDYGASNFDTAVARGATSFAGNLAVRDLARLPRRDVDVAVRPGEPGFWTEVVTLARGLGGSPVLLVSNTCRVRDLGFTRFFPGASLADLAKSFDRAGKEGRGLHVATIEGVEVFAAGMGDDRAWLFRADILQRVEFAMVGNNRIVELEFTPTPPELLKGPLSVRLAPSFHWADSEIVQLNLPALPDSSPKLQPRAATEGATSSTRSGPVAALIGGVTWLRDWIAGFGSRRMSGSTGEVLAKRASLASRFILDLRFRFAASRPVGRVDVSTCCELLASQRM